MQYVDEFRDPTLAKALVAQIEKTLADVPDALKPLQVMEVCGGHTHTLFKYGILQLLPDDIEFVHGPGCPVCVLPKSRLDQCIAIAEQPETIFCTFGDAMRVPGSKGSLLDARARGCDVRMVYSPMDALELAQKHPDKQVVFFALGFETTMPATAMTVQQAQRLGLTNFKIFCQHITIMPTLTALLNQDDVRIDGFLLPGHLSMIIGTKPYQPLVDDFAKPCVVTGFEPLDMLQALLMLLVQFKERRCEIENQYSRVVADDGNPNALKAMAEVYSRKQQSEWRGLGVIEGSGIALSDAYAAFDAEAYFQPQQVSACDPEGSRCGDVLSGRCKPTDCPLFGKPCSPQNAIGALMVSSEGACAAYYHYRTVPTGEGQ
ncbi:hydrogenase formation protein HypD [Reinekea marinisedimentorum]|uniref:Hydrogenase maturation factor n=1 Tax=Reinekea marinisedimentorum TaxID=230495 RepID=A0A4R3HU62_9GAMM|nr:hydrogenase formation protein HypD [Reinekea marinisedimentorum]TCS36756.1 hydrogenase expression/formation protein HypD [Reinekea marinisedimentorum]